MRLLLVLLLVACNGDAEKVKQAVQTQQQAEQASEASKAVAREASAAIGDARLAVDQAKATEERLIKIEHDLDALEASMSRVIAALADAKTEQERDAARTELESLQQQQHALREQIEAEKAMSAGAGSSR